MVLTLSQCSKPFAVRRSERGQAVAANVVDIPYEEAQQEGAEPLAEVINAFLAAGNRHRKAPEKLNDLGHYSHQDSGVRKLKQDRDRESQTRPTDISSELSHKSMQKVQDLL